MIAIIDIKTGNLSNIQKIVNGKITSDPAEIEMADKLIFPGVGSFHYVTSAIEPIRSIILKKINDGIPYLGICLGLEILFNDSEEGPGKGFEIFNKTVKKFTGVKTPHMGWNNVEIKNENELFNNIENNSFFYFMHSYYSPIIEATSAVTEYGPVFTSAIKFKNIYAVQFHPEKSGDNGIKILQNFGRLQ
ncbi:MAG: imidazole glycerol phosphate synthase subunit HisH [Ferroplasma sp.]